MISYDLLLSEILRNGVNSQDISILKQKAFTEKRFRQIMDNIIMLEKGTEKVPGEKSLLRIVSAQNISELNS